MYHFIQFAPHIAQPTTAARDAVLDERHGYVDSNAGLRQLCHAALATLSERCVPMLLSGSIGFAGIPVLASVVTLALSLTGKLGDGAASGMFDRLPDGLAGMHIILFVVIGALTRGAITWLALHPRAGMKEAWRAAGIRALALLAVSCGYMLCMTLGAAGLAVWLHAGRIDSDLMVYPPATAARLQRAALAQTVDALIPDPIAPHTQAFPRMRSFTFNATVNVDLLRRLRSAELKDTVTLGVPMSYAPATSEITLIPLLGLMVIIAGEVLWRGRVVMVMRAEPHDVLRSFIATLKFGITHFNHMAMKVWAVRLVVCGLCIAGIVLPCMMMSSRLVPMLARALNAQAVYPLSLFVMSAGTTIACALLTTFSTVFDVKLVMAMGGDGWR